MNARFPWGRISRPLLSGLALAIAAVVGVASLQSCSRKPVPANEQPQPPALLTDGKPLSLQVREPAVAGLFYPADPRQLAATIDSLLASASDHAVGELKALICPHAGYEFSGPVAAVSYRLLAGRQFGEVVLLAPSHYALFRGASVSSADLFRTPLGAVPISARAKSLASVAPFVREAPCQVQRPEWVPQSPRRPPADGMDTPDTWEHSDEVQVPFLQRTLGNFKLLPIVFGQVDCEQVAKGLLPLIDDDTLVIASSDLSHYYTYDTARRMDASCIDAILHLDTEKMAEQEACGKGPILTLLHLARAKGWKPVLLDARNSGDTSGNHVRVVGYSAVAFYEPVGENFGKAERKQLLEMARNTLTEVVNKRPAPKPALGELPAKLRDAKGCFVTLTERGELRGCIGYIFPNGPLAQAVVDNAESAALRDHRFLPVDSLELDSIEIEISVLTVPRPLLFNSPDELLAKLHPGVDGVVLKLGDRGATYLPQVWSQIPEKTAFLDTLSQKAGCAPGSWRQPGTSVMTYHVEHFKEGE